MHYYAEAGIPSYLLVEPRPTLRAKLFRLVDGHYPVVGEGSAEQMLRMTEPFEVEIDVAALER